MIGPRESKRGHLHTGVVENPAAAQPMKLAASALKAWKVPEYQSHWNSFPIGRLKKLKWDVSRDCSSSDGHTSSGTMRTGR